MYTDSFTDYLKNDKKASANNEILLRKLEKILHAVERVRLEEYPELRVTVSIGGAYDRGKLSQILRKADIAMYKAKGRRNSICIYED